ncbi:DUF2325 domain-containing protein [Burkholderia pseudomallei]|uniref:DUF2325 domain-containing protein n=1 Tax=Burkholderia pseudomallei TaxID=28450 RepID=UPI00190A1B98|nr:DUF2325 domain-containing protein [Burkholderia pseudomallei]MBK3333518.1 hypothetical protein [Burkholderia pseudomallei]
MGHPYMAIQERAAKRMNGAHVDTPIRRVTWTDEELERVGREAFEILQADGSLSNMEAVRRAQAAMLGPDRHRVIKQERDLSAILPIWADLRATKTAPPEPAPEPEPAPDPEPTKTRKTPVRWTAEERRKIAAESKRLLKGFEDMSQLDAIRKAIEYTMPAGRRREITGFDQVAWIIDEWTVVDELERATEREAREQAAEAERVAEELRRAIEAARAEAENAQAIDPASLPLETLIGALGTRIAGMLLRSIGEQLQDSIMQRITEALGHMAMPPAPLPEGVTRLHAAPRDRKPRVLVVGLIRQQEDDLRHALGEILRLDFSKADDHSMLEDKARNADLVVLMTKFISHKHQDTVKRVNEHYVYRNGSVSELKRWLTQWINGEVMTAAA